MALSLGGRDIFPLNISSWKKYTGVQCFLGILEKEKWL